MGWLPYFLAPDCGACGNGPSHNGAESDRSTAGVETTVMKLNSPLRSSSDQNPATETFDRLQRRTAIPIALAVAAVVIVVQGASIWLFPLVAAVAALYMFISIGGTRLIRSGVSKLRDIHQR